MVHRLNPKRFYCSEQQVEVDFLRDPHRLKVINPEFIDTSKNASDSKEKPKIDQIKVNKSTEEMKSKLKISFGGKSLETISIFMSSHPGGIEKIKSLEDWRLH